jgi:hypothetical protein
MWRRKKTILAVVLGIVVLVGSTAGIVFAQTGNGDKSQPEARREALLNRVSEIYGEKTGVAIDPGQLKDAFAQARSEVATEALERALVSRLEYLVDQGKMTQEEADEYRKWLQARPDTPTPGPFRRGFGFHGFGGGMKWGGMRWGGGHHCWGGPEAAPEAPGSGL